MNDRAAHRRRASDRAEERAHRAKMLGDLVAFIVASGQAEAAHRRRAEWAGAADGSGKPPATIRADG